MTLFEGQVPDVTPLPKPNRAKRLKKNGHPYRCNCRSCIGSRNRRKGMQKQRDVAKALGLKADYHGQLGNEENWRSPYFRCEVKSGLQVPRKLVQAYEQSRVNKASGDTRPVITVWIPEGYGRDDAILVGNL